MHLQGVLIEDRDRDTLMYAGTVQVRITDWFFLKKKAELKYIGLENAIVKFQRSDSVWRQQFIFDYFATPSTGKKKEAGIEFDLKEIDLKNVTFLKKDSWLGQDMIFRVGSLKMNANDISLSSTTYDINSLDIVNPVVILNNYNGNKPKTEERPKDILEKLDSALQWNQGKLLVKIGNLKIQNGIFKSDKQTDRAPYGWFDGQHMYVTDINGEISNARFVDDTVYSRLQLSAKERSGFELKNITSDLKLTPNGMFFTNLDLRTNNSVIRDAFSMSYSDMNDLGDFIHKVRMTANFNNSFIDSDDIAYFAPTMRTWNKRIALQGKVRGTVDDLVGRDMLIQAGNNTLLNGDITLTGLPDINQTFIDFKANEFRTTYYDAVTIVPDLRKIRKPDLSELSYLRFRGTFTGFIRDFVTFGTIETNMGTIRSDLNMKLAKGQPPVYSGNISTDNFRIGDLLDEPTLGAISMDGEIRGRGFKPGNRNIDIKGTTVRFVDFKGYRYRNIDISQGKLENEVFTGSVAINDENAQLKLDGLIDFSKTPTFNLVASVEKANLRNLKLIEDDLAFNGNFNLNFTGSNIDNFLGTASISNATILKDGKRLPFDSLTLTSAYENNIKTLTARSNEFEGTISGNFYIKDLPDAVTLYLNRYYPAYVKRPARMVEEQNFEFNISTQLVEDYVKLIDSSLSGFNYGFISGRLDTRNDSLYVNVDMPQIGYKQHTFDNVKAEAKGSLDSLSVVADITSIFINDSMSVPNTHISINSANNISSVSIQTGDAAAFDRSNLNAMIRSYADGIDIEFDPSEFVINGKTWTIDESGELILRKNVPLSGNLTLRESNQEIRVTTVVSAEGNGNDLHVDLKNVNLGDIGPYLLPKNRLEGLISGNIIVEDPGPNMRVSSENITTEFLRLDNDSLGQVVAKVNYNNRTKELTFNGNTVNQENYLDFNAKLFLGDAVAQKNNLITLNPRRFSLKILERFLGNLFSDIEGYLTGNVAITGPFSGVSVSGKGRLQEAGLKINFTQCFYKIQDTDIELTPEEINLDGLVLTDPVTGNPIYVEGGIEHESFKNMFFNLTVSTRKKFTTDPNNNRPVLLLNTTYNDNQQFYGVVKGTGSFVLTGPQSEMFMNISAIASDQDSSFVTIPPSKSRESGIADFLIERTYGREMSDSGLIVNTSNIIYDVDVTANPMVNVKVVLDPLTNDEIKGRGRGTLNIHAGTNEPLRMRGRFDILEGNYKFTFQSFLKREFELRQGLGAENYIEWFDDPYDARVQLDAIYTAERVSYSPLVNSLPGLDASALSRARSDVYVIARMTGQLFKPQINFSLDFPTGSVAETDPALSFTLQQLEENSNEMYKQVTYLIVLNSFAPVEGGGGGSGLNFSDIATNTISGIFLGVINDQLNKILGRILNNDKYIINLNTALYNRNLIDQTNKNALNLGSNVNFSIGRSFFNDKFIITVGGGFDAPLAQSNVQQSIQLLPDVTMEWLLNESGTLRTSFFYRENADYLTTTSGGGPGRARRYGGSLTYRKEFNHLFGGKKKKVQTDSLPPVPPVGPSQ